MEVIILVRLIFDVADFKAQRFHDSWFDFSSRIRTEYRVECSLGNTTKSSDYFSRVSVTQETPEFTIRNINNLLSTKNPIPHNLYSLIRAIDVFDQVENYKGFLDDVRL
jgi:hypothetical protein